MFRLRTTHSFGELIRAAEWEANYSKTDWCDHMFRRCTCFAGMITCSEGVLALLGRRLYKLGWPRSGGQNFIRSTNLWLPLLFKAAEWLRCSDIQMSLNPFLGAIFNFISTLLQFVPHSWQYLPLISHWDSQGLLSCPRAAKLVSFAWDSRY